MELVIFKSRHEKLLSNLKFHIKGQNIQPLSQIKYLGVILKDDLYWTIHLVNIKKKLSCSFGLLSKIRHYVPKHLLRTIYYLLFNSRLIFACEIWGRNQANQLLKKLLELLSYKLSSKTDKF